MASNSFNEYSKLVTRYVLDDPKEFSKLKKRLEMMDCANSKTTAAALGYLMAKSEEELDNQGIYSQIVEIIENNDEDELVRTDAIFSLIYQWVDDALFAEGFIKEAESVRSFIKKLFTSCIPFDPTESW
jgi:hypothetical protein